MKLKFKFFIFLVGIPSIALALFLIIALRIFVQDKSVYILEANMTLASSMANQLENLGINNPANLFEHLGMVEAAVFDSNNRVVIASNKDWQGHEIKNYLLPSVLDRLLEAKVQEGSFEEKSLKGEGQIYNFIRLPNLKMVLLLATPKASALRASLIFITKALMTFILLVLVASGISWLLSRSMTNPLEVLRTCMQNFSLGDFSVSAPFLGRDEIGELAFYFNKMVKQIQELVVEREDKLKIEVEMGLASEIQKKLFPVSTFSNAGVEFSGFYESASNCGGDWWFYFSFEDYFVVCIGDVTGHGVHSALLTSACRAAFAIISNKFNSTAEAMGTLNQCVYDTVQGSINMTAVIAALNIKTGQLTYTNASHESPVIMPNKSGTLKKSDFNFLPEIHGPRLGEKRFHEYQYSEVYLLPSQHILFYSDGLMDLNNRFGEKLGERRLLKLLGENYQGSFSADQEKLQFITRIQEYRSNQSLVDDLSFFFMKWEPNV